MGQKVNPISFRLPQSLEWQSRWFSDDKARYRQNLFEDVKIRRFLLQKLKLAGIIKVQIDRLINKMKITLFVSRPGVVIGRGGTGLELLKQELVKLVSIPEPEKNLELDVVEVKNPELSAWLVALRIAEQLEKRLPHRRVIAKAIERVMGAGAGGIRIVLSGRIAGAEIGRREKFQQGKIPLQSLRADIDYAQIPAFTKSGYIGVKVWLFKGEK
jgi:small subunit ribosomal protein S3